MKYDNYSHSFGQLRAWIGCKEHKFPGIKCWKWAFPHLFASNARCGAYLIAWLWNGGGFPRDDQCIEHMDAAPPEEGQEAVFMEFFHGK